MPRKPSAFTAAIHTRYTRDQDAWILAQAKRLGIDRSQVVRLCVAACMREPQHKETT